MPAVADVPILVAMLCMLGLNPQPSLDHRLTTPDARRTRLVYIPEWRDRINT